MTFEHKNHAKKNKGSFENSKDPLRAASRRNDKAVSRIRHHHTTLTISACLALESPTNKCRLVKNLEFVSCSLRLSENSDP